MVHLERKGGYGDDGGYFQIKIFYSLLTTNTEKMARAQGKHREFVINWSLATLKLFFRSTKKYVELFIWNH